MNKLTLAVAAGTLALLATPASAQHYGHGHAHGHVHHQPSYHGHHHQHRPVYYAPSHGHGYHAPTYVHHQVVYVDPSCHWAVVKHGYEHRKVWVCKAPEHKTVVHEKPAVKVVEAVPAPVVVEAVPTEQK